jgi:hypothetical protein
MMKSWYWVWLVGGLSLGLLAGGCSSGPKPGKSLQALKVQAGERLYQDARQSLYTKDYDLAVLLFQRFLQNYPTSDLRDKARWWLARSYQQMGNGRLALQHYRVLAQAQRKGPYHKEAVLRVAELTSQLGRGYDQFQEVKGLVVSLDSFQGVGGLETYRENLSQNGLTTLLVEIPCRESHDLISHTVANPVQGWSILSIKETLQGILQSAHDNHQTVFISVGLRCLGELEPQPDWQDWSYHPGTREIQPSGHYDLFNLSYQDFLVKTLEGLLEVGVDGVIFHVAAPLGASDGLSPWAVHLFEQDFGATLNPRHLFQLRNLTDLRRFQEGRYSPDLDSERYSPLFWRWAGWKARKRLEVMTTLVRRVKEAFPVQQFGLVVHPDSVVDPLTALIRYSEDWVAAAQSRFDVFLVNVPVGPMVFTPIMDWQGVLEQMITALGDPEKLWVYLPGPFSSTFSDVRTCCESRIGRNRKLILPKGVGRIFGSTFP